MGDDGAGRLGNDPEAALAQLREVAARPTTADSLLLYDTMLAHFGGLAVHDGAVDASDLAGSDSSRSSRRVVVQALFDKARTLARLGRINESHGVVAELVERFEYDADPAARRLVCRALFGQTKDRLSAHKVDRRSVLVDYRHILHIADRPRPLPALAAEALYHLALTHKRIAAEKGLTDHLEKAEQRHREVEQRFGQSDNPAIVHWVARCLVSRASTAEPSDAGATYEEIFERYAKKDDPHLQVFAMDAFLQWAARLLDAGRADLAAGVATRLMLVFANATSPLLQERLARASRLRAVARPA